MTIILDSFILVIKFYAVNYRALPKNCGISIITPFIGKYLFDPEGWIVHCPGLRGWRAWRITVRWRWLQSSRPAPTRSFPTPQQTYLFTRYHIFVSPLSLSVRLSISLSFSGSTLLHGKPTCLMYYIFYSSLSVRLSLSLSVPVCLILSLYLSRSPVLPDSTANLPV